jgi:hypothetical protein
MINETVSTRKKSDGKNLGAGASRQEKVKQWFAQTGKKIWRSVIRFYSTEPKAELPELLSDRELRRMAAEHHLRINGFVKGLDGYWYPKEDWWKPQSRS